MAVAQQPVLFPAAPFRQFSKTIKRRGGAALPGIVFQRRLGGEKYSGGTKSAAGGPCDEELVKRAEILYGGQMGYTCLRTVTTTRKFTGMWC